MEKFMFLFRGGDARKTQQSPEAMQQHMQKWMEWIAELQKKGKYVAGEPLNVEGKTVTGKKKVITDGPFVEGKEVVGGYFIVNAIDLNEAVQLSKDCPIFDYDGIVEVRPVQKL